MDAIYQLFVDNIEFKRCVLFKAVIVIIPLIAFPFAVDYYDSCSISCVLKNGQIRKSGLSSSDAKYFPRVELEKEVSKAIYETDNSDGNYFLIVGEHGAGKTALIKNGYNLNM